jgi:hypothetical protein
MCPLPAYILAAAKKTNRFAGVDSEAKAYIESVEAGDGAQLEPAVITAINRFVVALKQDNVWGSISTGCVLAGARTLTGAIRPLKGAATPIAYAFQTNDYDRKTGLTTNDLNGNKYIDTGFSHSESASHASASRHCSVFITTPHSGTESAGYIGRGRDSQSGSTRISVRNAANGGIGHMMTVGTQTFSLAPARPGGFFGLSRSGANSALQYLFYKNTTGSDAVEQTFNQTAQVATAGNYWVFKVDATAGASAPSNGRIGFYSIGSGLAAGGLQLFADLAGAIP